MRRNRMAGLVQGADEELCGPPGAQESAVRSRHGGDGQINERKPGRGLRCKRGIPQRFGVLNRCDGD